MKAEKPLTFNKWAKQEAKRIDMLLKMVNGL